MSRETGSDEARWEQDSSERAAQWLRFFEAALAGSCAVASGLTSAGDVERAAERVVDHADAVASAALKRAVRAVGEFEAGRR